MSKSNVSLNQPKGITYKDAAGPDASATPYSAGSGDASAIGTSSAAAFPDALTLRVSGDSWQGSPEFTVRVDGKDLGFDPVQVTASRADGQSQEFTFYGTAFSNGPHKVDVVYRNDVYGGSRGADRNLFIEGATFNGVAVPNASAALYRNGSASFTVGGGAQPDPEPTPSPAPKPAPSPTPEPAPSPAPKPTPSPTPEPTPSSAPKPAPSPTPDPAPSPAPKPAPSQPSGPYVLQGQAWPDRDVTWSFGTKTYAQDSSRPFDSTITGAYQNTIRQAMQKWESVSGLNLREVADAPNQDGSADIRIGFADLDTSQGGALGIATTSYSGSTYLPGSVIRLNDPKDVPLDPIAGGDFQYRGTTATLYQAALHEIGHTLGLEHTSDPNAIMYPSITGQNKDLNNTDIAGIQKLYGSSSTSAVMARADESAGSFADAGERTGQGKDADALIGIDGQPLGKGQVVTTSEALYTTPDALYLLKNLAFACDHDDQAGEAPAWFAGANETLQAALDGLADEAPAWLAGLQTTLDDLASFHHDDATASLHDATGGVLVGSDEAFDGMLLAAEPKAGVNLLG